MKLFLSSKGLVNQEIEDRFLSFVKDRKKVSIITTAAEKYKELNRNCIKLNNKLTELGFNTEFVDLEFSPPEILNKSEIIILNGGNPYYLLYHMKKSKSINFLKRFIENNNPIYGISAGAFMLLKDLRIVDLLTPEMNTINLKSKEGLGVIKDIIVPHYDRFIREGKINKKQIDDFERETNCSIIRMGEYQCVVYEKDNMEIIGKLEPTA